MTRSRSTRTGTLEARRAADARGHADKFWAVALACQRERQADRPRAGEIGVRVLG